MCVCVRVYLCTCVGVGKGSGREGGREKSKGEEGERDV